MWFKRLWGKLGFGKDEPIVVPLVRVKTKWTGHKEVKPPRTAYDDVDWDTLVLQARALVGTPYKFGAEIDLDSATEDIKSIDCSELIEYLYHQRGITVPDGSFNQIKVTNPIKSEDVKIGDLGFKWWPENEVVHHVGIYIGHGVLVEAKGVQWGTIYTQKTPFEMSEHFARWGRLKELCV